MTPMSGVRRLVFACVVSLAVMPALARQAAPPSAPAPSAASSKVWLGREAEFEAFLKTAPVEREEGIPVGVTRPRRVYFAPGGPASSAVFKPLQPGRTNGFFESYKSEIAAYELDKILGLGMVPPTVERKYRNETGSLQLWVEHLMPLKGKDPNQSPSIAAWNRQVYRHRVWDALTANIDRNAGNLLVDPAWNLILIDHSRAFTVSTQFPFPLTHIDRELLGKLRTLDAATLREHLGPLLFDGPGPVLKRRDLIVKHFDALVKEKGEAAVLVP
jgi:hypothetical protein